MMRKRKGSERRRKRRQRIPRKMRNLQLVSFTCLCVCVFEIYLICSLMPADLLWIFLCAFMIGSLVIYDHSINCSLNTVGDDKGDADGDDKDDVDGESVDEAEFHSWIELRLHPLLMKSIYRLGFKEPTPIQKACIPAAAHQGKVSRNIILMNCYLQMLLRSLVLIVKLLWDRMLSVLQRLVQGRH